MHAVPAAAYRGGGRSVRPRAPGDGEPLRQRGHRGNRRAPGRQQLSNRRRWRRAAAARSSGGQRSAPGAHGTGRPACGVRPTGRPQATVQQLALLTARWLHPGVATGARETRAVWRVALPQRGGRRCLHPKRQARRRSADVPLGVGHPPRPHRLALSAAPQSGQAARLHQGHLPRPVLCAQPSHPPPPHDRAPLG